MSLVFFNLTRKIVAKLDPKLEKYRPPRPEAKKPDCAPKTKTELVSLIAKAPQSVLSGRERRMIAAVMSFDAKLVRDFMLPKSEMVIIQEDDFLGPLKLDRLYKSGFQHFPLVDQKGNITGLIHTCELDALKIKRNDRAVKYKDPKAYYVRDDYSMRLVLAAILRTNCHFLIVVDRQGEIVGLITYEMVAEILLGEKIEDDFEADDKLDWVVNRKI